jgi:hypothetical protein
MSATRKLNSSETTKSSILPAFTGTVAAAGGLRVMVK